MSTLDVIRTGRATAVANVRAVMMRDDACDQIVPSTLRLLIGRIDELEEENGILVAAVERLREALSKVADDATAVRRLPVRDLASNS